MGLSAAGLGLMMAGASAASTLLSSSASNSQRRAQAEAQEAQADQLRKQAAIQEQANEVEAQASDKQRAQLHRQYEQMQSANRVSLGAGNVDLSSGSALSVADGNALAFASDVGENAYQKAIKRVEGANQVASTLAQANVLDANASYQKRAASNLAPTLLGVVTSGASGFLQGYSLAGGKLGKK